MEGMNYYANHQIAPQGIQGTPMFNVEVGDGNNPPGDFFPAVYLKAVQSENRIGGSNFVLMPGKVIAYDTNKRLIPAGLAWDKKNYDTEYAATTGTSQEKADAAAAVCKHKYNAADVQAGVVNAQGFWAQDGDVVADSMFKAGLGVTVPIGYMRYSALQANGSNPNDPSTWYKHAYDTGGARAYSRQYYIQVPIVEINARVEAVQPKVLSHRIALYPDVTYDAWSITPASAPATPITFYVNGVLQGNMTQYASPSLMVQGDGTSAPTQFALVGRTIFFNNPVPANFTVKYTPKTNLPFACLKATVGGDISIDVNKNSNSPGPDAYYGKTIGYDIDSNYVLFNATNAGTKTGANGAEKIGRVLDIKEGASKDLALVRTYYRDFGLWGEAPGSATDGRNAILSIANAPKYIARIQVNFNQMW